MSLIPSPCTGICTLDPIHAWCRGCARTGDEIAAWSSLETSGRTAIWASLPARRRALAMPFALLPWTGAALLQRLATGPALACCMGQAGAVGMFASDASSRFVLQDGTLRAQAAEGAMLLRDAPGLRAFDVVLPDGTRSLILALHRARLKIDYPERITLLGRDDAALLPGGREQELVDLGLGGRTSRFCIRTDDPLLIDACRNAAGLSWLDKSHRLIPHLLFASPTRVVCGPLGRIEVTGRIGSPTQGCSTHFLPARVDGDTDLVTKTALPPDYRALAVLPGEYPMDLQPLSAAN